MNCTHCRDVALDIGRGIVHPDEAMALDHASRCPACSRFLLQQRELTTGLRALAAQPEEVPSEAMEQRLLAAFDAAPIRRAAGRVVPAESRWAVGPWLKIAAAIVLAATAIVAWQWRARPIESRPVVQGDQLKGSSTAGRPEDAGRATEPAAMADTRPVVDSGPRGGGTRRLAAVPRPAGRPARSRIVQATGFLALPAAAMLPPFERGEIVRVQIGLASLADLGFNVQPDAIGSTPINADLLVGQDGQARAIRLVTDTQDSRSRR